MHIEARGWWGLWWEGTERQARGGREVSVRRAWGEETRAWLNPRPHLVLASARHKRTKVTPFCWRSLLIYHPNLSLSSLVKRRLPYLFTHLFCYCWVIEAVYRYTETKWVLFYEWLGMIWRIAPSFSWIYSETYRNLSTITSFTGVGNAFCVFYSPFIKNILAP